jgi:hypothetical protein
MAYLPCAPALAPMPAHEKLCPMHIRGFGAQAAMEIPNPLTNLIQQSGWFEGDWRSCGSAGFHGVNDNCIFIQLNPNSPFHSMVYDRPHDPCKPQRPEYFAGFAGDITLAITHAQRRFLTVGERPACEASRRALLKSELPHAYDRAEIGKRVVRVDRCGSTHTCSL